jgi:DNA repair protein RadC
MTYEIISTRKLRKKIKILNPIDIYKIIKRYAKSKQEIFLVITLNGGHEVIGIHIATIGLINRTIIHPREVYRPAIADNAAAVVVAHNHPSEILIPSPEDREINDRLEEVSKIIGIHYIDHLIIGKNGFYSFAKEDTILVGKNNNE